MPNNDLGYDPFLCEECSKYGYCKKINSHKDEVIKEKLIIKIEYVPSNLVEEEIECFR